MALEALNLTKGFLRLAEVFVFRKLSGIQFWFSHAGILKQVSLIFAVFSSRARSPTWQEISNSFLPRSHFQEPALGLCLLEGPMWQLLVRICEGVFRTYDFLKRCRSLLLFLDNANHNICLSWGHIRYFVSFSHTRTCALVEKGSGKGGWWMGIVCLDGTPGPALFSHPQGAWVHAGSSVMGAVFWWSGGTVSYSIIEITRVVIWSLT